MKKLIALALVAVMLVCCLASCNSGANKVKVIDIKLTEEEYAFAVQKGDAEMLKALNVEGKALIVTAEADAKVVKSIQKTK